MISLLTATFGRTTTFHGAFHDPRTAERARRILESTNVYEEVTIETVPVYSSVDDWHVREYPEEAAGASEEG